MQIGALKSLSTHMGSATLDLSGAAQALCEQAPRPQLASKVALIRPSPEPASSSSSSSSSQGVKPKAARPALTSDEFPSLNGKARNVSSQFVSIVGQCRVNLEHTGNTGWVLTTQGLYIWSNSVLRGKGWLT